MVKVTLNDKEYDCVLMRDILGKKKVSEVIEGGISHWEFEDGTKATIWTWSIDGVNYSDSLAWRSIYTSIKGNDEKVKEYREAYKANPFQYSIQ